MQQNQITLSEVAPKQEQVDFIKLPVSMLFIHIHRETCALNTAGHFQPMIFCASLLKTVVLMVWDAEKH